jgi:hypothetical protein
MFSSWRIDLEKSPIMLRQLSDRAKVATMRLGRHDTDHLGGLQFDDELC